MIEAYVIGTYNGKIRIYDRSPQARVTIYDYDESEVIYAMNYKNLRIEGIILFRDKEPMEHLRYNNKVKMEDLPDFSKSENSDKLFMTNLMKVGPCVYNLELVDKDGSVEIRDFADLLKTGEYRRISNITLRFDGKEMLEPLRRINVVVDCNGNIVKINMALIGQKNIEDIVERVRITEKDEETVAKLKMTGTEDKTLLEIMNSENRAYSEMRYKYYREFNSVMHTKTKNTAVIDDTINRLVVLMNKYRDINHLTDSGERQNIVYKLENEPSASIVLVKLVLDTTEDIRNMLTTDEIEVIISGEGSGSSIRVRDNMEIQGDTGVVSIRTVTIEGISYIISTVAVDGKVIYMGMGNNTVSVLKQKFELFNSGRQENKTRASIIGMLDVGDTVEETLGYKKQFIHRDVRLLTNQYSSILAAIDNEFIEINRVSHHRSVVMSVETGLTMIIDYIVWDETERINRRKVGRQMLIRNGQIKFIEKNYTPDCIARQYIEEFYSKTN